MPTDDNDFSAEHDVFTVACRIAGERSATHIERTARAVCLAAVDFVVEDPEVSRTLQRAVAHTRVVPSPAWPRALADSLADRLAENASARLAVTSLIYLGVYADPTSITVVHAGDLRACLFERESFARCTRDHTTRFEAPEGGWFDDPSFRALQAEGALLTRTLGSGTCADPEETRWPVARAYTLRLISAEWHRHRAPAELVVEQLLASAPIPAIGPSLWVQIDYSPPLESIGP